jgi:hypothetical protein
MDGAVCRESAGELEGMGIMLEAFGSEGCFRRGLSGAAFGDLVGETYSKLEIPDAEINDLAGVGDRLGACISIALVEIGMCHLTVSLERLRYLYKWYASPNARTMAITPNLTRRCCRRTILPD